MVSRVLLAAMFALSVGGVCAVATPPSTRQSDQETDTILREIDAGAASARRSQGRAEAAERADHPQASRTLSLGERVRVLYLPTIKVIWPALLVAAALAIGGGIAGVFVVLRQEALVAISIPQLVMLGAAIGMSRGWPTLPPAVATVALAMVLVSWSRRGQTEGLLLPALYIAGMCLSILIIAGAGAHLMDVQNMFTGVDVAVEQGQAVVVSIILLATGIVCALLWRRWLLLSQAPAMAELARLHPVKWNALFLCLLAVILVVATHAVGTVMVIALLFLPAATVLPWSARIPGAIAASCAVGVISVVAGLVLSTEMSWRDLNWPLSHSIGGAGFAMFLVSHVARRIAR